MNAWHLFEILLSKYDVSVIRRSMIGRFIELLLKKKTFSKIKNLKKKKNEKFEISRECVEEGTGNFVCNGTVYILSPPAVGGRGKWE